MVDIPFVVPQTAVAELALEASRAGTWHWDMATGAVVWDPRLEELHGLRAGEFRGTFEHWVELLHPDEVDGILVDVQEALERKGNYDLLHRTVGLDGMTHWLECRGQVIVDAEGNATGTIGVGFDVTDRMLAQEQLREAQEAYESVALRLQESLLGPPMLLARAGHAARYVPAAHGLNVGGDWYNAQPRPDGRIAVTVGDVVGSGLEAAAVMGQLRSALAATTLHAPTTAEALATLDTFAESVPGAQCATVGVAFIDIANQRIEYARAGHLPPVLVSPQGEVSLLDDAAGPPLAVGAPGLSWTPGTAEMPPGSLLLLYSDGLVERRRETLDAGLDRLCQVVARHWRMPLEPMCDRIVRDMLDDVSQTDDVALLALRTPVSSRDVFLRKVPSDADALSGLRSEMRAWLADLAVDDDDIEAILISIGEACTNAIEHAYLNHSGLFRVEASRIGDNIVACVTDTGTWREATPDSDRGRGLQIITALMDAVELEQRKTGTSVTMRTRVRFTAR